MTEFDLRGFRVLPGYVDPDRQVALVAALRGVIARAPLFAPATPSGKAMSVRITSAGRYGWVPGPAGYAYRPRHPAGQPWPEIPPIVLNIWRDLVGPARDPDCCLINFYGEGARMGLHQDRDEADLSWPVLSVSLGDEGLLRVGTARRGGGTVSHWLRSGDVVVMGGDARLAYHGVDRIRFGSSRLLPRGGRINLTCRVVE